MRRESSAPLRGNLCVLHKIHDFRCNSCHVLSRNRLYVWQLQKRQKVPEGPARCWMVPVINNRRAQAPGLANVFVQRAIGGLRVPDSKPCIRFEMISNKLENDNITLRQPLLQILHTAATLSKTSRGNQDVLRMQRRPFRSKPLTLPKKTTTLSKRNNRYIASCYSYSKRGIV